VKHLFKKHNILINSILIVIFVSIIISATVFAQADNPILKNVRTADPSPLVYNGRFYIVCGQDEVNTNTFNMYAWRLMSSADMNTWTDHGVIARPTGWMPTNRAWASSLVYKNSRFYLYIATDWAIGVMTATNITGPYTDALGKPLIDSSTPGHAARDIDPQCFIDSDGQAYLFWGGDGNCRYARLNSNMTSLATSVMDVPGLTGSGYTYLEAPFVIKSGSTYFLMYADQPWPSKIRYATSSSISGPWTHRGVIGDPTGTGTNHEGAAYFNGQWWYTYHTEELSNGNPYSRSVCVDPMTISGSTINKINYSSFWMGGGSGTYVKLRNRATNLCIDGMGRTSNGSNAGQYSSGSSYNQQWVLEAAGGSYYKIKNRATGLYLDGMGRTSNGSICGQYSGNTSNNQQWTREAAGSYYKFKNRATGLYLDGMGSTSNGADLCQWGSSQSYNQQWSVVAP
jgi:beta-xylosidase